MSARVFCCIHVFNIYSYPRFFCRDKVIQAFCPITSIPVILAPSASYSPSPRNRPLPCSNKLSKISTTSSGKRLVVPANWTTSSRPLGCCSWDSWIAWSRTRPWRRGWRARSTPSSSMRPTAGKAGPHLKEPTVSSTTTRCWPATTCAISSTASSFPICTVSSKKPAGRISCAHPEIWEHGNPTICRVLFGKHQARRIH